jgi:cytochrome c
MKRRQSFLVACVAALTASLWLARIHPFGDAGLYAEQSSPQPIMEHTSMPPAARATLMTKCIDCHSNQTHAPIYGHLAPVSWLMERDIVRARNAMNLSKWDSYTPEEQEAFRIKILLETRAQFMPPPQYRLIHRRSRITDADIQAFSLWTHGITLASFNPTPEPTPEPSSEAGDASRGKDIFEKRCTGCHAINENREGPRLHGVFGRTSGSVADFTYSPALKNAHIVWNETTLNQWLTDPDTLVPNNNMEFRVVKPQERQDLIRYLRDTLSK